MVRLLRISHRNARYSINLERKMFVGVGPQIAILQFPTISLSDFVEFLGTGIRQSESYRNIQIR